MLMQKREIPKHIVETVSGRCMLRGTLHANVAGDANSYITTYQDLIRLPDDKHIIATEPKTQTTFTRVKLYSKEEAAAFEKSIKSCAISLGAPVKFHVLDDLSERQTKWDNDEEQNSDNPRPLYYSEVECLLVPVACVQLSKENLTISEVARKAIDNIIPDIDSTQLSPYSRQQHLYQQCINFFETFGSHVNVGECHFGGIVTWKAIFQGNTKSSRKDIQSLVSNALQAHVQSGFSKTGEKILAKQLVDSGKLNGPFEESDLDNTSVSFNQYGGPPITRSVTEEDWKQKLQDDSSTWTLIDRGDATVINHVGIWDFIKSMDPPFYEPERTGAMMLHSFNTYLFQNRIAHIIENAYNYSEEEKLEEIEKEYNERKSSTENSEQWEFLLRYDISISEFLLELRRMEIEDMEKVVQIVHRLIDDSSFPNRKKILLMIGEMQALKVQNQEGNSEQ